MTDDAVAETRLTVQTPWDYGPRHKLPHLLAAPKEPTMGNATSCQSRNQSAQRYLRLWTTIASAAAICVGCGSDNDKSNDDAVAGRSAGGGTAGAATGGKATSGTTNNAKAGAAGNVNMSEAGRTTAAGAAMSSGGSLAGGPTTGGSSTAGAAGGPSTGNGGAAGRAGSGAGGTAGAVTAGGGTAGAVTAGGGTAGVAPTAPLGLYVACADTTGSIMYFNLNRATGAVTPVGTYTTGVSNSWATLNAAQNRMYVNSRTEGRITTLSRDPASGALAVLGKVSVPMVPDVSGSAGAAGAAGTAGAPSIPAGNPSTQVVALDGTEHFLLAANYSANYVYVYSVAADGTIGSMVASQLDGVSSHQPLFAPGANNRFVLVPYRGSDTVAVYQFNATTGGLTLTSTFQSDADNTAANTGPRHLAFSPTNDKWVYAINEVAGSLSYLNFDNATGTLTQQQTLSSVPADYTGTDKFASELAVAPTGKFVYVSNRYSTAATYTTEGSLGVFAVNAASGQLSAVGFQSSRGALPRHFELSKDGSVLVVGNQNSNNIAVFSVNQTTGELTHKITRDVCATPFFVKLVGS